MTKAPTPTEKNKPIRSYDKSPNTNRNFNIAKVTQTAIKLFDLQ